MTHFIYLLLFAFFVAVAFGVFTTGTPGEKVIYGIKVFFQFVFVSLIVAWIFYFLPF